MRALAVMVGVAVLPGVLAAQAPPRYLSLRQDEDWSPLRDPALQQDALDEPKYVPLGGDTWLSFGGDARLRYEYFDHAQWGSGPQDGNGYWLQRYLLHGDLHAGAARVFVQLQSTMVDGREGGPRPTDEDRLDGHQAFVDATGDVPDGVLTARLGRQELQYGSSRLISVREGPNTRLSFDGARLLLRLGGWHADAFAVRPVETEHGVFDDGNDRDRALYGVYATGPLGALPDGHVDLYALEFDQTNGVYDQGAGREERRSLGTRLFGKPSPWDYDLEAVWQFGSFGNGRIEAWTIASDVGVTLAGAMAPRLSTKIDIASGDRDPAVDTLQTFQPMFPRGSYFGEPALIGPANLVDVHPAAQLWPADGVRAYVDWDWFWRQSAHDGLYNPAMTVLRSGASSDARYVGSQLQIGCDWALQRHVGLTVVYAHFFAGAFLEQSGSSEDIDYATVWLNFRF